MGGRVSGETSCPLPTPAREEEAQVEADRWALWFQSQASDGLSEALTQFLQKELKGVRGGRQVAHLLPGGSPFQLPF